MQIRIQLPKLVRIDIKSPRLHSERSRPSTSLFWASKAPEFYLHANPDPAFHSNADPDSAFHSNTDPDPASKNNADPIRNPGLQR